MIYKKELQPELLKLCTGMYRGTLEKGNYIIKYYVNYPVLLALMGNVTKLEQLIKQGVPVMGIDDEILSIIIPRSNIERGIMELFKAIPEMSIQLGKKEIITQTFDVWEDEARVMTKLDYSNTYCTTVIAAICSENLDMLKMLVEHGAIIHPGNRKIRQMLLLCGNQELNQYVADYCNKIVRGKQTDKERNAL